MGEYEKSDKWKKGKKCIFVTECTMEIKHALNLNEYYEQQHKLKFFCRLC